MEITEEWLKRHHACKEGIKFFKMNKLECIDSKNILEAEGDFRGFKLWLKHILDGNCKYDSVTGNLLEKFYNSKHVYLYTYNNKNQLCTANYGMNDYTYSYDDNGNVDELLFPNKNKVKYNYDSDNNIILEEHSNGNKFIFEYANGVLVNELHPNGKKIRYVYTEEEGLIEELDTDGLKVHYSRADNGYFKIFENGINIFTMEVERYGV